MHQVLNSSIRPRYLDGVVVGGDGLLGYRRCYCGLANTGVEDQITNEKNEP